MAEFLTTKDALSRIERVIRYADRALTIITPFVQISDEFARRLRDADARGVAIRLVCRTADLAPGQQRILADFDHLSVFDDPRLHAKCFINEHGLVLTSLNFYQASEQNNEMGVYLDPQNDPKAYEDAVREAESIIVSATSFELSGSRPKRRQSSRRTKRSSSSAGPTSGHCLRCGKGTAYNPAKPYCPSCFRQWARFKNPAYADDHCHGCGSGEAGAYSMEKPECYPCYKKNASRAAA